jgi:16S rRNA processing protein RimM|tara:strand:- start:745 stop:1266 length:522 start_codon:yes stop_codon:yes gene_type:complete
VSENIRVLGKISTAFGIKGWVKVYSYTQPMTNILEYPVWHIRKDNRWQEFKVLQGKPQGKGLVASLQGITDRDLALSLHQCEVGVPEEALPELEEDEHYWFQLIGLKVVNTEGVVLGQVKELFDSGGGNQVMTVTPCEGSIDQQQRLLPFVEQYVLEVDLDSSVIQVDWDPDF